ncbi:MAG TPA: sugar ABC transporter substrate-binding protein [Candidatus Limnocylindrales bacterium]|nr:sugar ABC transporter substrate-binding protein [Candidatus Limnocylindrales bacterium]
MFTERSGSSGATWRSLLGVLGAATIVASACGGAASPSPSAAAATASTAASSAAAPSPSASDAGYTGAEATISYSIWGDPAEIKNQQAIVDAFHAANPKITVKVTVSDWDTYWDKLQTGIAGGDAPDVFAMDGPLFPDYQSRDVLLDLKPYIDKSGYDLGQLADQAVKDFTTPEGQFGLPRDLNVIALFYNKKMFDAAKIPYPDDTWDWAKLVEVAHKLTIDTNNDKKPDQWGFYTETSDMENYWSSLVWQNGGDIIAPDAKSTLLGTDQAVGGLQFLQDLIWKEKVMPDPALFAEVGDAFEQGKAAMEANGSWLVATHQAAGIDLGIAPLPKGPAGQATSINPTGAVVYAKSKNPDAAWEFVKYLASPAAQTKLMELRASLPANKEVLAGPFSSSFEGAKVLADSIAYAHLKPSFKGYNDFAEKLQTELDANVYDEPKETARQAIDKVLQDLNEILAGQ